jgi:hypothetical protein
MFNPLQLVRVLVFGTLNQVIDEGFARDPTSMPDNCIGQSIVQEFVPKPLRDTEPSQQRGLAVGFLPIDYAVD